MDWQERYAAGDTPWDEGEAHPAVRDYVAEAGEFTGRILVPGCGRGHEVRAISTEGNEVTGLDIAPDAVAAARLMPRAGRERYVEGDFFNLPPEMRGSFDWVVEHTCFCAIEPRMRGAYAVAAADALKHGGRMFAVFYLNPEREVGPPFGVLVSELDLYFGSFFELEKEWVPARTFEGRESRELVRVLRRR